jgi:predicted DNA-binding protein (UPF0251 family)
MPRPRRFRRVWLEPNVTYFKPAGVRMIDLDESIITVDEFEAVRLKDMENLDQEECAKKMKISQPTFNRLILSARKKIADAIVNGKAIKIKGGVYKMAGFGRGRGGRGRMRGPFAAGPGGTCVCPKCKTKVPHRVGVPCYQVKCPKCGTQMIRGD